MKTGSADLPLHGGQCPAWLFRHMKALGRAIVEVVIEDAGVDELLRRLSNPFWFQGLGCVMGFDWHSSGLTTTVCAALKEGLIPIGRQAGIFMAGGKGKTARKTPAEITLLADKNAISASVESLLYASKMAAKIDSAAVQDGYQIYQHCFIFTSGGSWAVIQQGMNSEFKQARRYHWLSHSLQSFIQDPHLAICCNQSGETLNLVARDNYAIRENCTSLLTIKPEILMGEIDRLAQSLPSLSLPGRHSIPNTRYLNRSLRAAYEQNPRDFEELLQTPGVGSSTLRALCMVAEIAFGTKASYTDPVRYAFAHGGKDGFPFPVNEADIENSYRTLTRALRKARAGQKDQMLALRRLAIWHNQTLQVPASPLSPSLKSASPTNKKQTRSTKPSMCQPELF